MNLEINPKMKSLVTGLVAATSLLSSQVFAQESIEFNRDVRPILTENCFACHGPDSATREAGLRLDQREAAMDMGAIEPGSPDGSSIWERIISEDDDRMPPESSHKELTAQQKQTIRKWIEAGAEYQPHWAFIAPEKQAVPAVDDARWQSNPIDAFVYDAMKKQGLSPAGEADRRTLARRVALDITGLPPSPELVEAFVNDSDPAAYEKLIDQLLEDPAWGEHRARYWLDVARYADTHGIHFDNYREMWAYRDWVIDAFNQNMPFDQFTMEQLAGDLLPNPSLDQQVATGFNRCNITTNEGGIIDEEYRVLYARDRTETTAQTWMGLTVGCAVCHDHKFDPFSQQEFYELSAFFNNTTQAVRDGNIKDTPPTVFVPSRTDRQKWEIVDQQLAEIRQAMQERRTVALPDFEQWLSRQSAEEVFPPLKTDDLRFQIGMRNQPVQVPWINDGQESTVAVTPAPQQRFPAGLYEAGQQIEFPEVGDFENDQPFSFSAWIRFQGGNNSGSLFARMDEANAYRGWDFWSEGGRVGTHIINAWPDNALKVVTRDPLPSDQWHHVTVTYDGSKKASGVRVLVDGKSVAVNIANDRLSETIKTATPLKLFQRSMGSRIPGVSLADVRIYSTELTLTESAEIAARDPLLDAFGTLQQQPEAAESRELVFQWYLRNVDSEYQSLVGHEQELVANQQQMRTAGTLAHVMHEQDRPAMAFVLNRGEYDQRRDEVGAHTPAMLPPMTSEMAENRLGLAQWLLTEEHPLTARVTVNRFWQSVFGRGLVETSGDFGLTGTPPSHPELLDWLAVEFRENGWDVKQIFKQILLSQTYRQSAMVDAETLELDPNNIWLARGPRFRMDAEMVRDYVLSVSGELVSKLGGPSVRPYQPEGVWEAVAMPESNTRNYRRDTGENLYRRSLYTFWKRAAPPASMDILNAPSREVCTVRRERTNTPLQALVTLNDPQFVEAARQLATEALQRDLTNVADPAANRLQWLAQQILLRPLTETEVAILSDVRSSLEEHYQSHPEDAKALIAVGEQPVAEDLEAVSLAVWTMTVNQLMNLDETLCK